MTEEPIPEDPYAGGLVALQMAEAHLNAQLASIDSVDSKAMFLVGLNAAVISAFVAGIAALSQPLVAVPAPAIIALVAGVIGGVNLWPREVSQFPSPGDAAQFRGAGYPNDMLAWSFLETVEEATRRRCESCA